MNDNSTVPEEAPTWAVRLEAKVDIALARQAAVLEDHSRDIATLEEEARTQHRDLDRRLVAIESASWITPRQLAATLAGLVACLTPLMAFFEHLFTR